MAYVTLLRTFEKKQAPVHKCVITNPRADFESVINDPRADLNSVIKNPRANILLCYYQSAGRFFVKLFLLLPIRGPFYSI